MAPSPSSLAAKPRNPFLVAADLLDPPTHPYTDDPVGFSSDVLGFTPWSKQVEIMRSVVENDRTSVRACHGVGKTAVAAQIALWFLGTHPNSRVLTTAPTWSQVANLLWREIRAAVARAHQAGRGEIFPRPSATKLELGDQWFAIGLSTNEPERFQGHHADHILLIVDEASGVDEKIFEAAEGFLTAEGAKVLLIGNPTQLGGQFHRSFTVEAARWSKIHISALDSPNETGETVPANVARALPRAGWVDETRKAWGKDSPMFQVRALGEFPTHSENAVIHLASVVAAQARDLPADNARDLIVIGCDVARFGSDETVITQRVGQQVRIVESYIGQPTTHTAARVAHWARQHPQPAVRIVIDDAGVGGGVTDQLNAEGFRVTAFNGAQQAFEPLKFPNRRSELWFQAAAQLEDLDLDTDDQLAADLTAPKYGYDLKMRRVVEKKDETKKRLGRSPDRADSMMLTLVPERSHGAVAMPSPRQRHGKRTQRDDMLSADDLMNQPM